MLQIVTPPRVRAREAPRIVRLDFRLSSPSMHGFSPFKRSYLRWRKTRPCPEPSEGHRLLADLTTWLGTLPSDICLLPRAAPTIKLRIVNPTTGRALRPMVATDRISEIFADARAVHADALRLLAAGDIRDAAEKAWCATKRATDALILARTGVEPEISSDTTRGIAALASEGNLAHSLRRRYQLGQSELHGACFNLGVCEPADEVEQRIRDTADYITDAEALAGYSDTSAAGE